MSIHIPLSHPGKHQYGKRDSDSLRHFYIQKQLVFLVAHCTLKALDQGVGMTAKWSRYDLLVDVLKRVSEMLAAQSGITLELADGTIDVGILDEPAPIVEYPEFDRNAITTDLSRIIRLRLDALKGRTEKETSSIYGPG
ncbi:hypothetical protein BJX99DRAFT_255920 [Aspergillus californicus]